MYFLGLLLLLLLYSLSWIIGVGGVELSTWGEYVQLGLRMQWEPLAFGITVAAIAFHLTLFGGKDAMNGFRCLLRYPKTPNPETAGYFRALSRFMIALACLCFLAGIVHGIYTGQTPQQSGSPVRIGMYCMIYSLACYLCVFWPISNRCEPTLSEAEHHETKMPFPVRLTLYGIAVFFLIRMLMSSVYLQILSQNPNGRELLESYSGWPVAMLWLSVFSFNPAELESYPFSLASYFDVPSLVVVLATMGFLRMMAGPLKNRYNAIPVSLLQGTFWGFTGLMIVFSFFDPKIFSHAAHIVMLPLLYGIILGISYFFKDRRVQALFLLSFPMVVLLPLYPYVIVVTLIGAAPFEVFLACSLVFWAFFVPYMLLIRSLLRDRKERLENQNAEEPLPEQAQAARDTLEKAIQIQRERKHKEP